MDLQRWEDDGGVVPPESRPLPAQLVLLSNQFQALASAIGQAFVPVLQAAANVLQQLWTALNTAHDRDIIEFHQFFLDEGRSCPLCDYREGGHNEGQEPQAVR